MSDTTLGSSTVARVLRRMLLASLLLLVGCSGGLSGTIEIAVSWAPAAPESAQTVAVYLTIDNGTDRDDRLVSVASDQCGTIELHDTQIDDQSVMRMRRATEEHLAIPSGESLEMVPGGLHVMCISPSSPFSAGETFDLTVNFENAADVAVTVEIESR